MAAPLSAGESVVPPVLGKPVEVVHTARTDDDVLDTARTLVHAAGKVTVDVADVDSINVAMLAGAGWPVHRGGITPYIDEVGASEATGGLFHPDGI